MTAPFDLSETDRLLSTTRAVRRRLDLERPVEREVILDCIRLSQQAPTASNTQKWRWMVVMDAEKRKALGEIYGRGKQFIEQAKAQIDADDTQTHRVYDSAGWLLDHIGEAPALVIPCVEGRVPDGAPSGMAAAVYGSIYPAIWSAMLAARAEGVGSSLTTVLAFKKDETFEILGVPEDKGWRMAGCVPMGYPTGTWGVAKRTPAHEVAYRNHWGTDVGFEIDEPLWP